MSILVNKETKLELSEKVRKNICNRHQFLQGTWNFERMQNGGWAFAMIPAIESEDFLNDDGELVILKAIEDNGEEILASIDDDDEFDKVSEYFMKRIEEIFDDCDCDDEDCDCCCDECGCD